MSKKPQYDLVKFRNLVKQGKNRQEIMVAMGIPDKGFTQFSSLELRLIKEDNHIYIIPSGSPKKPEDNIIKVGNKVNIVIPTKIIKDAFKVNDKFNISIKEKKIILTLIEDIKDEKKEENNKDKEIV
jgi:hypothetical protein